MNYLISVDGFESSEDGSPDGGVFVDGGLVGSSPEGRRVVVLVQNDHRDWDLDHVRLALSFVAQLILKVIVAIIMNNEENKFYF